MQGKARLSLVLLALLAASCVASPTAAAMPDRAPAAQAQASVERVRGITHKARGRLAYGRLFADGGRRSAAQRARDRRKFGRVNRERRTRGPRARSGPPGNPAATQNAQRPRLDAQRRSDPPNPPHPPLVNPQPPGAQASGASGPTARAAAAKDFTIFRNIPLDPGSNTLTTHEPSVANDRNAVLFTGNQYAAVSPDNGLSWDYLQPGKLFSAGGGYPIEGGFCCDQVAYAVDRGGYSLIFWLLQYYEGSTGGLLRLAVYQGRQELLDQADFCTIDFVPEEFPQRDYPSKSWFDFNHMAASNDFLYISSKVMRGSDDLFLDGLVWRIPLDELDDEDRCAGQTDRDEFTITSWSAAGAGFNPTLVENADRNMFWASHCKDDPDNDDNENECDGDESQLIITKVPDSTTVAEIKKKDVDEFNLMDRGDGVCRVPDNTDPCDRAKDVVLQGYHQGDEVGWLWMAAQGGDFEFPHIRRARFEVGNLSKIDEKVIWSHQHSWMYPAIGVNSAGHIALAAYPMGPSLFPRASVALIDDVAPDTDWDSLDFHEIITSDAGTHLASNGFFAWGDYSQVREYGDCTRTWVASVHSQQGGTADDNAEGRFAWFGREEDGCADLSVVSIGILPFELAHGETLLIGETTRNIGSGLAGASTTRYYLSRDADLSSDDTAIGTTAVPAAGNGTSWGALAGPVVPEGTGTGTFYVLACADDDEAVAEISDTNNCLAAEDTIVVTRGGAQASSSPLGPADVDPYPPGPPAGRTGELQSFDVSLDGLGQGNLRSRATVAQQRPRSLPVSLYLASGARVESGMRLIGRTRVTAQQVRQGGGSRVKVRIRARLPRRVTRRRFFPVACVGAQPNRERCVPARKPFFVVPPARNGRR